jgi:outer membrane protein TolC
VALVFEFEASHSKYEFATALLTAAEEYYKANLSTCREGLRTIVESLTAHRDLANAVMH